MDNEESHLDHYEDGTGGQGEDKTSMVKVENFSENTQRLLSSLAGFLQKHHMSTSEQVNAIFSKKEKWVTMGALLTLRWMQTKGVGNVLHKGFLARGVFGTCAPSEKFLESVAGGDTSIGGEQTAIVMCSMPFVNRVLSCHLGQLFRLFLPVATNKHIL